MSNWRKRKVETKDNLPRAQSILWLHSVLLQISIEGIRISCTHFLLTVAYNWLKRCYFDCRWSRKTAGSWVRFLFYFFVCSHAKRCRFIRLHDCRQPNNYGGSFSLLRWVYCALEKTGPSPSSEVRRQYNNQLKDGRERKTCDGPLLSFID